MQIICPTCHGKGSIDDPKITGAICYCGPNGESCPQIICMSCGGMGWIHNPPAIAMTNPFVIQGCPRWEAIEAIEAIEQEKQVKQTRSNANE